MIVSSARRRAWLMAGVVMVIVFSGVKAVVALSTVGIDRIPFGVEDNSPVASAASTLGVSVPARHSSSFLHSNPSFVA